MVGAFRNNARTRMEFLELIKLRGAIASPRDWSVAAEACVEQD
jgi:hypothetical protein